MAVLRQATCPGYVVAGGYLRHGRPCPMHPVCTCPPVTATTMGATCVAHGPQPVVWLSFSRVVVP